MKNKFICILILLSFQLSNAQELKFDNYCFLLGTLDDYMGRSNCMNEITVDTYYQSEKKILVENYNLLKSEYSDLDIDSIGSYELCSAKLAANIKNDYSWEESLEGLCSFKMNEKEEFIDIEYIGKLNWQKVLKTESQKASYVIGVLARHGAISNESYTIRLANSFRTFSACAAQLYELGCSHIETSMYEGMPYTFSITFTPNGEFKLFLKKQESLLNKLKNPK